MKNLLVLSLVFLIGCASVEQKQNTPPEFHQKVLLSASDDYTMYQAPRSSYDLGDLQSFHSQHTFSIKAEDSFKEIFDQVEMVNDEPKIETSDAESPPFFEVKMIDMGHDYFDENVDYFRAEVTIAAAMKTPRGEIVWQETFRGRGYVQVDNQFGTRLGPEQAVIDAVRDALEQLQSAVLKSPQVRLTLKHYQDIERERSSQEIKV